ncbi:hypothetical protein ACFOGJ_29315 [Marinibaculum pumilum]|uniref:STAS domain-containing protein n=1 Tax=Marinibaculum pumilum TaxID=1766165 RepID=A0ABV7L9Y4_9PROT
MIRFSGADHLIAVETAPDGLQGAFLLHLEGRVPPGDLFEAYRRLGAMVSGPVLNLIVVNIRLDLQLSYSEFAEIHRGLYDCGIRRLNLVVANPEPAIRHLVSFGDEVGRLQRQEIHPRVVADRSAAVAELRALMAQTPDISAAPDSRPGGGMS